MNTENVSTGKIIDKAFVIYKENFSKQFAVTVIINLIYMAVAACILWIGYELIPAAPPRVSDLITRNLRHIIIFSAILLISLFFKLIITSAIIIVANNDQSLLKSCLKTARSIPCALLSLMAEFIICLAVVIPFGFIIYASKFEQTLALVLLLIAIIIFLAVTTVMTLSAVIYQTDNSGYINSIKKSVQTVFGKKRVFCFFKINILWLLVYWGFFIIIACVAGLIFPVPAFLPEIPYLEFVIVIIYKIFIAYLLTMIVTPIGKNILYTIVSAPNLSNEADNPGFGAKLFSVIVDFYIQLAVLSGIFYIIFTFLSKKGSSVFTMNLPFVVWLAVLLMLAGIMLIYKLCFKYVIKRPTLGEKIMGIKSV